MDINKIRRRAYREIWKEGKTHQQVYDALREETQESPQELAIIICQVASPARNQEKKSLWMLASFLFLCVAGLRTFALIETPPSGIQNWGTTLPLIILGILVPLYSIYGVSKAKMLAYGWGGMSSMVTIILVYAQTQYIPDALVHVTALVAALAMISGIVIPRLMKIKFITTVEKSEIDGKVKSRQVITIP